MGNVPNFAEVNKGPHLSARTAIPSNLAKVYAEDQPEGAELTRFPVDDAHATWNQIPSDYRPVFVDYPRGETRFAKPDDRPHPADPRQAGPFRSHEVDQIELTEDGRPLNPCGPTGLTGRGILNSWGPTHAADGVLTRYNPENGQLEVLLIERGDATASAQESQERAFPGGKVDPGESEVQTARRELFEETGISGIEVDFPESSKIFSGYMDDERNTDNAWMETVGFHLHLDDHQAQSIVVPDGPQIGVATADAPEVTVVEWVPVTDNLFTRMFGGHRHLLYLATIGLPRAPEK